MSNVNCPVCKHKLDIGLRQNERNERFYLMMVCPVDGAHFRAFINDRDYVAKAVKGVQEVKT